MLTSYDANMQMHDKGRTGYWAKRLVTIFLTLVNCTGINSRYTEGALLSALFLCGRFNHIAL